jgi:hypothetical protein
MSRNMIGHGLLLTCLVLLAVLGSASSVFAFENAREVSSAQRQSTISSTWNIVRSANAGSQNELKGVDALSATNMWAVGDYHPPAPSLAKTLAEHWNGTRWCVYPTPNLGVADYLNSVTMISSNDVWAVGNYFNSKSVSFPLIEHWNGKSWKIVTGLVAGAPTGTTLYSVTAIDHDNVWAVGQRLNGNGIFQTLIEHWNGTQWKIVPSPNIGTGNNTLFGVTALSSTNAWAVGVYDAGSLVVHWNGKLWQVVPSPASSGAANILTAVTAIAANDIWAVGNYNGTTLTEHWNGKSWSIITSPNVAQSFNFLFSIAAKNRDSIWAVGYFYNDTTPDRTLILHWNGTNWRIVSSPNASNDWNQLFGVTAVSNGTATAVGYYFDTTITTKTLVESNRQL